MMKKLTRSLSAFGMILILESGVSQAEADYKTLTPSCKSCKEVDNLVNKFKDESSADTKLDLALEIAKTIKKINVKGKTKDEQAREIYFAINASVEVLEHDFDSETVIGLVGLRAQAPDRFDFVFWGFPLADQKQIVERMKAAKDDKLIKNAAIPIPKAPKTE